MRGITLIEMQATQIEILRIIVEVCNEFDLEYYLVGGTLLGAVRHQGFIPWDDDIDIALPRAHYEKLEAVLRQRLFREYTYANYKDNPKIPHNISKVYDNRTVLIEPARKGFQVKLGVYVDLFPLDGVPRNRIIKEIHFVTMYVLKLLLRLNVRDNSVDRTIIKKLIIAFVQKIMNEKLVIMVHNCLEKLAKKYDYCSSVEVCNYFGAWGKREYLPKSWIGKGAVFSFEGCHYVGFRYYDKYLRKMYGDYWQLPPLEKRKSHHKYEVYWKTSKLPSSDF